jgi:hypothetical protein
MYDSVVPRDDAQEVEVTAAKDSANLQVSRRLGRAPTGHLLAGLSNCPLRVLGLAWALLLLNLSRRSQLAGGARDFHRHPTPTCVARSSQPTPEPHQTVDSLHWQIATRATPTLTFVFCSLPLNDVSTAPGSDPVTRY